MHAGCSWGCRRARRKVLVVRRGEGGDPEVRPEVRGRCGAGHGGRCDGPVIVRAVRPVVVTMMVAAVTMAVARSVVMVVAAVTVAVTVVRSVMVVVMVVLRPATNGSVEEPQADAGDEESAGGSEPHQDGFAGQVGGDRQSETENEDTGRVREGDRGADGEGVASGAAAACEVGGHDGLAVAGHRRVGGPQDDGEEQSQQSHRERDLAGPDEGVEGPGHLGQRCADHARAGEVRHRRQGRPLSGLGVQCRCALVECGGEGIFRVLAQFAGRGRGGNVAPGDAEALAGGGHFVPADACGVVVRLSLDLGGCAQLGRGAQPAGEATGLQTRLALLVLQGGRRPAPVHCRSVHVQVELTAQRGAGLLGVGARFGLADPAVAVGVDGGAFLEGCDLRAVDDDVGVDPVGPKDEAGVVVDAEVAQGWAVAWGLPPWRRGRRKQWRPGW